MPSGASSITVRLFINTPLSVRSSEVTIGDILHAQVLGQHFIILNAHQDAVELFEKRSGIYSDRPAVPMIDLYVCYSPSLSRSLTGRKAGLGFQRCGDALWR